VRVAAFTKYDREAASTRQRVLQYLPPLAAAGIHVDHYPLLGDDYVRSLVTGNSFSKAAIARSYGQRMLHLLRGPHADVLWIYAELFPYLPAAFERMAFRSGKPVIYDFDDAFFLNYADSRLLKGKLDPLVAGAAACCCGNEFLRGYASRLNGNAITLPTVVDTDAYVPVKRKELPKATIGWIGSPPTWTYVRPLLPVLRELCGREQVRFLAVGAGIAARGDMFERLELRDWSEQSEIASVQEMDIGIMPMVREPWAEGKSGYKLVQYMACGVPVVATPVGVNSTIARAGIDGLLADTPGEWRTALEALIGDAKLRLAMGAAGRKRVVETFSLQSQAPKLVDLFKSLVD
jgi:glycosyltransferase involved in cell wall biosynthesis